jgi:hypothetical protein
LPSHITHRTRDETTGTTTTNRRRGRGREILFLQRHETQSASEAMSEGLLSVVESGINNGCDFLRFNRKHFDTPLEPLGTSGSRQQDHGEQLHSIESSQKLFHQWEGFCPWLSHLPLPLDSRRDDSCCLAVASVCQFDLVSTRQGLLQPER